MVVLTQLVGGGQVGRWVSFSWDGNFNNLTFIFTNISDLKAQRAFSKMMMLKMMNPMGSMPV